MYGGLFGDLPAAKGEKGISAAANIDGTKSIEGLGVAAPGSEELPQRATPKDNASLSKDSSIVVVGHMPPTTTTTTMMKKTKTGLAKSIGTAGTTMAFVPTTIKRKKAVTSKPLFAAKPDKTIITSSHATTSTTTTPTTNESLSVANHASTPFALTTTIVEKMPHLHGPVDIHAPQQFLKESPLEFPLNNVGTEGLNHSLVQNEKEDDDEEEEVPILDPYDPYVPNDLLQYWDREAKKEEQRQLEAETQRAVEQQALLRKRLEEERQELLQRQQQQGHGGGNLERLETTGRGRGVSNLPAWLMAKAQHETQDRLGEHT